MQHSNGAKHFQAYNFYTLPRIVVKCTKVADLVLVSCDSDPWYPIYPTTYFFTRGLVLSLIHVFLTSPFTIIDCDNNGKSSRRISGP